MSSSSTALSVNWDAFAEVFGVGVGVTVLVVVLFALGAKALAARAQALQALSNGSSSRRAAYPATALAVLCFGICVLVVAYSIYLTMT